MSFIMSLVAQRASDFQVVLTRVVSEVEVHGALVSHATAHARLTQWEGPALAVNACAVGTAELALGHRVTNAVVGAVLVVAASL